MTDPHSRFHSITTYSGHARRREYTITVRHSPWRTKVVTLSIDGIEHLPGQSESVVPEPRDADSPSIEESDAIPYDEVSTEDESKDLEVRVRGWLTLRIVVRRPTVEGNMVDREEIHITTSALGGAGEAEVHSSGDIVPLLPESGSKSEQRDLKRTANPTAYALIAGLTTALRLCIPLLGLGALLGFLTEPVKAWLSRHLTPILEPIFQ